MFETYDKKVGVNKKLYVFTDLSKNHGEELDNAKLAIKVSKELVASAAKIQKYTPNTMTINSLKPYL